MTTRKNFQNRKDKRREEALARQIRYWYEYHRPKLELSAWKADFYRRYGVDLPEDLPAEDIPAEDIKED